MVVILRYFLELIEFPKLYKNRNRSLKHFLIVIVAECLPLLVTVLEGAYFKEDDTQQSQFEISITTLRVIRRIVQMGGAEVAAMFSQIGGTSTLVWYLETVASTDDPLPLLALEAIRTLVGCLAIGQGDDPEQYVPLDDQLDAMEIGKKKGGGLFGRKKGTFGLRVD